MTEKPLNVAAIGLGWVTQNRHLPAIQRTEGLKLYGVIERRSGIARDVAKRFGLIHHAQTASLVDVDWIDQVDAVTIGAPPAAHHDLVLAALNLGKHVLTEKPFAMSITEGEEMVRVARANARTLAVVHNFQFARAFRQLESEMHTGRLGTVRRIAAVQLGNPRRRLPRWYPELPLGLYYDESPHFFYLIRRLAGARLCLTHSHLLRSSDGGTTPAAISLVYRSTDQHYPVTIDCMFESPISEWYIAVFGDVSLGVADIFRDIYIRIPNDGRHSLPDIIRTSILATAQHWWQHLPNGIRYLSNRLDYGNCEVFRRFAAAASSGTDAERVSPDDALAVLQMQHESIQAAGRIVL